VSPLFHSRTAVHCYNSDHFLALGNASMIWIPIILADIDVDKFGFLLYESHYLF